MIINIRGTSGTGKSTIVREIMKRYQKCTPYFIDGRRKPIGYICEIPLARGSDTLAVIGHYESDCGGCDNINKMADAFEFIKLAQERYATHVLYEGLFISGDVNRVTELHEAGMSVLVIALGVPLETCLERVNGRRRNKAAREGREYKGDVNPKNTESKYRCVQNCMKRLKAGGVPSVWNTNDECLERVKMEFGL